MLSAKALAAAISTVPAYIEDVFSTYLYTGNGSTQTITNGIDLAGSGGLVWVKGRSGATAHALYDTDRGATKDIASNTTAAETTQSTGLTAFNASGFSLGSLAELNTNTETYASWSFRQQAKFFDVVTWTGDGSTKTIPHNLGSAPGCIVVKRTDAVSNWRVYHRSLSLPNESWMHLNTTDASFTSGGTNIWNVTSTTFQADTYLGLSVSGATYVAYLFAHNAGGFGLSGTDNVISCGSFTTDGSGDATVSLGYEPQWALIKPSSSTGDWALVDIMRNWVVAGNNDALLYANTSAAEATGNNFGNPTATGFTVGGLTFSSTTYIYVAIRRGPMEVPTSGTSVFSPVTYTGNATARTITGVGFPSDLVFPKIRDNGSGFNGTLTDRLRGPTAYIVANDTAAETVNAQTVTSLGQDGFSLGTAADVNRNTSTFIAWNFRRAPGFFDEVCYTGTGAGQTVDHNLGVIPELLILKNRSSSTDWPVKCPVGLTDTGVIYLNSTTFNSTGVWQSGDTSTTFKTRASSNLYYNQAGQTYVAYLFATVAGVSKVGSYTGTGTTLQVNCGFASGARFVLIKRTDSTGDWYVWDSARGIVAGNDPYLLLNSTAAEVTSTDYVDTYSAGFEISSTAPAAINASGGTFIFLAIA